MKDYNNSLFNEIKKHLNCKQPSFVEMNISEGDIVSMKYYLTRNFYYAVIVDNYPVEIVDKYSLLEALYYQVRLITMHDLNWDALDESLNELLNNLVEFEGICLLFRNKEIKQRLPDELTMLIKIVEDINNQSKQKYIKILMR